MKSKIEACIIDTIKFKVAKRYANAPCAAHDMSEFYEWYPDNKYIMIHSMDTVYEYWHKRMEESGKFHEGLGITEDMKQDMFKDWVMDSMVQS